MSERPRRAACSSRYLMVLACALWGGGCESPDLAAGGGMRAPGERANDVVHLTRRDELWARGGADDTAWAIPSFLLLTENILYVSDPGAPAITALDRGTGETLWRYAKPGDGPGELRGPAFMAAHPQGVLIADDGRRSFLLLSTTGELIDEMRSPAFSQVTGICVADSGRIFYNMATFGSDALFETSFEDQQAVEVPFPFALSGANPLETALDLASAPGASPPGCIAARKNADGIVLLPARDSAASYVEQLAQRPYTPPEEMRDTTQLPIAFSLHADAYGDTAFVWFGGGCRRHCIDVYALPHFAYQRTIRVADRFPIPTRDVTTDGKTLYLLGVENDAPRIAAYRLPDATTTR